jgi:hypothetical protein
VDRFGLSAVDDAELDEAGELVELVVFTLEGEEALFVGEDVPLADDVALVVALVVDVEVCAWLVQDGSGLGGTFFLAGSPEEPEVELGLGSGLGDLVGVDAEEPLTLGLGLSLGLLLGLLSGLGLVVLLWLSLDDVTGAVGVVVGVLVGLVLVTVCDAWVDGDEQALGVVLTVEAAPGNEEGNVSSAAEGRGAGVWLSVAPAPVEGLLLLLVKAWLMS